MRDTAPRRLGLAPASPWTVSRASFDAEAHRPDIRIGFAPGSRFACPLRAAAGCPAYDTGRKTWRHLNCFQHETGLTARVPRVRRGKCGTKTVCVPGAGGHAREARPDSGFALPFAAMPMTMIPAMPPPPRPAWPAGTTPGCGGPSTIAPIRPWHHADQALARRDASNVARVAIGGTAARRGRNSIARFVDIDEARVPLATEGRGATTAAAFADDLSAHAGEPDKVCEVCIDMGPAFSKGTAGGLPEAAVTFGRFHAAKTVNDAAGKLRRAGRKAHALPKGTRYIWSRNPGNLPARQRATSHALPARTLKTARACQIRLALQEFCEQPSAAAAGQLGKWPFRAARSRLEPAAAAAHTVKRHWDGIPRWFDSEIANGRIGGINSLVRAAKSTARAQLGTAKPWPACWPASSTCGGRRDHVSAHPGSRGTGRGLRCRYRRGQSPRSRKKLVQ
jgi:transposase